MKDKKLWEQREKFMYKIISELELIQEKIDMYEDIIFNTNDSDYIERVNFLKEEKQLLQDLVKIYYEKEKEEEI